MAGARGGPPSTPYLSVVIPAFDEVQRIRGTVERTMAFLGSRPYSFELIVVLDGGRPGAAEECARGAGGCPQLIVLDNGVNRGKGFSVRRGVLASRGAIVAFVDADLSLPIEGIDRFIAALDAGADIAIGSRVLPQSVITGERQVLRQLMGRLFNRVVQQVALPGVHDTQCGFKVFRGPVARSLFSVQRIDRFSFDVEVLSIARRRGYRVTEVPVTCDYHPTSSVRWLRDGPAMMRDLVTISRSGRSGDYDEA